MRSELQGLVRLLLVLVLCILLLGVIVVAFHEWFGGQQTAVDYWKAVSETTLTFFQIIGIAIAGWWTWHLFVKKRIDYPQVGIELQASHFPLAEGKVCLNVTALVTNTGNAVINPELAEAHVRQLRPFDPRLSPLVTASGDIPLTKEQLQSLRTEDLEIAWPEIGYLSKEWDTKFPTIEPGETEVFLFDFVVGDSVQVVRIMSYFSVRSAKETGWRNTILYDLEQRASSIDTEGGKGPVAAT